MTAGGAVTLGGFQAVTGRWAATDDPCGYASSHEASHLITAENELP